MRLEKKRILKEDGRYLLFYHSVASASAEQTDVFAAVAAESETTAAPSTAGKSKAAETGSARQERSDV